MFHQLPLFKVESLIIKLASLLDSEVIAASCYAQTGVTSHTVDVDLHSKQALRGAPPGKDCTGRSPITFDSGGIQQGWMALNLRRPCNFHQDSLIIFPSFMFSWRYTSDLCRRLRGVAREVGLLDDNMNLP